ncbi:MAG: threonylcarbamoyl-AMP synthase [Desulfobacula sp.]|jgi:L-threonylcarbamoyladenylate synthase|uniref:L-threonylcarbamoyladenylate synthase n=1 Tax=Desulfobacula sp. TaxID=2593537 RepID=UPI001E16744A|nr:threonylcarbamoyl-AMP synthase [Desulfobacula sp.]MBT3387324.1 threonylcarbamoyl-AMP synthase [Desulfobacula sp.]MBT3486960.1 threonylcarbamoyl-AMP synthase [Desulfobacula sp.]MBT3806572.1 threonylcarbamoyl-AMP synthase [Desulfobacula sp.]MBT4026715.1 threonylcarbamoyl-AMP synthase [Desulfobacula sp.]
MKAKTIFSIDPVTPEPDRITKAGKILQENGVVIFPAKCLYGIAANALDETAIKKIFHLKQRPWNKPVLILIRDEKMLPDLVTSISLEAYKLMDAFWPGNITLVFEAKKHISKFLTAGTCKIGIRIPSHPVAKALVEYLNFPITGTSANLSSQGGCSQIDQLPPALIGPADLILDAGRLKGGKGSTIVDVTSSPVTIIREGEVSTNQIIKLLEI